MNEYVRRQLLHTEHSVSIQTGKNVNAVTHYSPGAVGPALDKAETTVLQVFSLYVFTVLQIGIIYVCRISH